MRIRSTRPEFYRSKTIAQLDWSTRYVLKALESYVDDNGVGKDDITLIATDAFPRDLVGSPPETLARLTEAISALCGASLVVRYEANNEALLYIDDWKNKQRIDKPSKGRYPRPDGSFEYSEPVDRSQFAKVSGALASPPEKDPVGTGEQGNRGTEEQDSCASADAEREFDEWWEAYPRKRGKGQAATSYKRARKHATAEQLLAAVTEQSPLLTHKGMEFAPYPATWLNGARWLDEIHEPMSAQESNSIFDRPFKVVPNE